MFYGFPTTEDLDPEKMQGILGRSVSSNAQGAGKKDTVRRCMECWENQFF